MNGIRIQLIVREGCHLCAAAQDNLGRVIARFANQYPASEYEIQLSDITDDPEYQKYTDEVPVLLVNGTQEAFWRIDEEQVFRKLESLV